MARTVLGVAAGQPVPAQTAPMPQAAPQPAAPAGAPKGKLLRTMLGVASPFQAPPGNVPAPAPAPATATGAPGTPAAQQSAMNRTIIGQGIPMPQQAPAQPAAGFVGGKTMLGVAAPAAAPAPQNAAGAPKQPAPAAGQPALRPRAGTMLGVAMPGIAPIAPGVAKPDDEPEPVAPVPTYVSSFNDSAGLPVRRTKRSAQAHVPLYRRPAIIVIFLGLLLAIGALAFVLLWRAPTALETEARLDPAGKDVLHVTCSTCADGAVLRIGAASGVVSKRVADIALPAPLAVGENRFVIEIERSAKGRRDQVPLVVRIGYRLHPDVSRLEGEHPTLNVKVEAMRGASVLIDGKPTVLGPDGRGSHDIDLTADCAGPADEARIVERSIAYSVNMTGSPPSHGAVSVRIGVLPLHLDAPFERTVVATDSFLLAGRTARGARVTAGGAPVQVAPDGSFAQTLPAALLGDNAVVVIASSAGQASRSATVTVKRVARLEDEARDLFAKTPLTITELGADVARHTGQPVAFSGEVYEARVQNHMGVVLLDVQKGCAKPPCRVRVLTAGDGSWARGERVSVFGTVTRLFSDTGGGAMTMPEIRASFVLKGR
jgi:hypothetical protein